VCDSTLRFTNITVGQPASCHDAHLFNSSPLGTQLAERLTGNYHLIADSAYALTPHVITPLKGDWAENSPQGLFNYFHSSTRIYIECAFGVLKNRFRILKGGGWQLSALDDYAMWITACCTLHNLCIDYGDLDAPCEIKLPGQGGGAVDDDEPDSRQAIDSDMAAELYAARRNKARQPDAEDVISAMAELPAAYKEGKNAGKKKQRLVAAQLGTPLP
jgi:hypothetical protein